MSKELLSGNEAIARGAYEYGVRVAAAYPGTPSTEILENIANYPEIASQWSPNEKVALEVGIGASFAGARTVVAMKMVGVNVAADPLLTLAYTGVNGGLVLISADDPGIHSSQNEQDNRFYGRFARIPVIEPSDSQEAKDFLGEALNISEMLDTVVLYRTTTRISHSKSMVQIGSREDHPLLPYVKNIHKNLMIPNFARMRQPDVLDRFERMVQYAETSPLNIIEWGDRRIGIITGGISYQYVKEVCPDASILKLGLSYPLPNDMLHEFAAGVEKVIVIEELEPFLLELVRLAGINAVESGLPRIGELTPAMVGHAVSRAMGEHDVFMAPTAPEEAPVRPPVMCPGCPHRAVFYILNKLKLTVTGDIGCYTLGALPPLNAMDMFMDMGASIGLALGMEKANPEFARRTVAVIGDSTFLHSGMTGLLDMVYNNSTGTVVILDNATTAMTGHQEHPATGKTLMGEQTARADLELICKGLGAKRVRVIDPFQTKELEAAIKDELAANEVSVIIARRPCVLLERKQTTPMECDPEECRHCNLCMKLGCPSMRLEEGHPEINEALCAGCGLCSSICPFHALKQGEKADD